jgi:putative ABC transport system permease protein
VKARDVVGYATAALRGHLLRSVLALLGVSIGVTSVIVLTSLGEGARRYIVKEFSELGTNLVVVLPGKIETTGLPITGGVPNDLTLDDAEALRQRIPAIRRLTPLALGEAQAAFRDRSRRATVIGGTSDLLAVRHLRLQLGRFLPEGDPEHQPRVCVIGSVLQRELFRDRNPLGEMIELGGERFRVIGVLAPRGVSLGMDLDEVVEIPVAQCMRMFDQRSLFRILVEVSSHAEIPAVRDRVIDVMKARHGEEDVTILTEDAVLSTLDSIMAVLTAALGGIASISLVVAGVAIMNVMLVSVSERTGEIGLLKALGATGRQVTAAFLTEAALLSLCGGVLGLLGAAGVNAALRQVWPKFPIAAPTWAIVAAVIVSAAVGLLFGALPARRAARLDPVTALGRK